MDLISILKGESNLIEYKESLPSNSLNYIKTVVAFSNGKGGKIIFGVKDKTLDIVGIPNDKAFEIIDSITNAISDVCYPLIIPEISLKTVNDKTLIIVEIDRGKQKPYYVKSLGIEKGTYIRVAGTTRLADRNIIKELVLEGSLKSYDKEIIEDLAIEEKDINHFCSELYNIAMLNKPSGIKKNSINKVAKNQLLSWGIIVKKRNRIVPTVSYALLTGNSIFPTVIQCAVFKNESRTVFIDKREFSGNLFKQLEESYNYVLEKINFGAEINGIKRVDKYEIPPEAIREVIANAIIHRNYLIKSNIQIAIYKDRVEVTSPGGLVANLSVEQIKTGISQIRNEAVASAFKYANIIEQWGSGIPRIIELSKEYKIREPEFIDMESSFRVNIFRYSENRKSNKNTANSNSETDNQFLNIIKNNPKITLNEVANQLNISVATIKRIVAKLQDNGIIYRIGNNRKGEWKIN